MDAEHDTVALPVVRTTPWPDVLGLWVGVLMVVVGPAVVLRVTPTPRDPAWAGLLAVTTICGVRYGFVVRDGRRRPVEMTFWVFTYVFMGLAPLIQLRLEEIPETTKGMDPALDGITTLIVVVGVLCFCAGLVFGRPRRESGPPRTREVDTRRVLALAAFATLCSAYYIAKIGVGTLFSTRMQLAAALGDAWPQPFGAVISALGQFVPLVSFVALVKLWEQQGRDGVRRSPALLGLTVAMGLELAVVLNPIANAGSPAALRFSRWQRCSA
jgi:hypothetical protein